MKTTLQFAFAAACFGLASLATAQAEFDGGNLRQDYQFTIGNPESIEGAQADVQYSNVTSFLGQAYANGGAADQAGNAISRLVADDITPLGTFAGQSVTSFTFSVANLNTVAVSARARVRFYQDNAGVPGTLITGYTFNALAFNPGVALLTANVGPGFNMPGTKFWAGLTFDNNTGATGASLAQINSLGVGLFNPPTRGSSVDGMWLSTAAGSNFVSNPAGAGFTLQGTVANAGWSFTAVPEPGTIIALAAGLGAIAARRRRAK